MPLQDITWDEDGIDRLYAMYDASVKRHTLFQRHHRGIYVCESYMPELYVNEESLSRLRRLTYLNRCGETGELKYDYGICDNINQLITYWDWENDPRCLVIFCTPVRKCEQPPCDGWRWEKWGQYIGTKIPQADYLYDEPEIELVYVFTIFEKVL